MYRGYFAPDGLDPFGLQEEGRRLDSGNRRTSKLTGKEREAAESISQDFGLAEAPLPDGERLRELHAQINIGRRPEKWVTGKGENAVQLMLDFFGPKPEKRKGLQESTGSLEVDFMTETAMILTWFRGMLSGATSEEIERALEETEAKGHDLADFLFPKHPPGLKSGMVPPNGPLKGPPGPLKPLSGNVDDAAKAARTQPH